MAVMATVLGRPEGPGVIGHMASALLAGAWDVVADDVALQPGWVLFSVDLVQNEAVFLSPGPGSDIAAAPFSYQLKFDRARRVIRLPLDHLPGLAAQEAADPPGHLFNIGPCGSTLLRHVINRSGAAIRGADPLVLFDLAMARAMIAPGRLAVMIAAGCR